MSFAEELANTAALALRNACLYRDAQQASRAKDEFLATVAHELRTPLTAMLGWASLLQSRDMPEEKRVRALATIERNAKVQSKLIEDLVDVSRIISGNLRVETAPVDLAALIELVVEGLRPAAAAKRVRVMLDLDPSAAPAIGDAPRLQQVLWNLLANGVKFTPEGGKVTVSLERIDSQIRLCVTDTGIGIDAAFLPHVFERFTQARTTSARVSGGLGLGLSIVRHLVGLHGGTITVESAGVNCGTTFQIMLPAPSPEEVEAASAAGGVAGASATGGASTTVGAPSLLGLHVLLVDDQEDARLFVAEVLDGHGARVTSAGSVAEALDAVEQHAPDILVSDIGMPGEDGYSLIGQLRALANARQIPAVALTAYARPEDRERAMQAGFQAHVVKPVEPRELLAVIAGLARRAS